MPIPVLLIHLARGLANVLAPAPATMVHRHRRLPGVMLGVLSGAGMSLGLAACSEDAPEPLRRWQVPGADLARGQALMAQYQCGSCHRIPGVAGDSRLAPALTDFGRRSYIAGQWPNTPQGLQQWLMDPPGVVPGATMPRLGVSATDARDMAGYLLSLQ
ncbi:Cytochrome c2 [Roseateles sp. YR242]|uniref:c-type cytochrome n=1 Tax=Roseateles sp. YR242 TaxID=1855305 RepID=UPI0008AAC54E|nr:c-type cytochrome [Roseateles sp. YR242]SEL18284.1 Cytochrome c2 [Roseateles sp. YR242]